MMRWLLPVFAGAAAYAATISGAVLDSATARPLARAHVVLKPIPGTGGKTQSARATHAGQFRFLKLNAGMYLLTASRTGFAPFQYGQRDWKSAGKPMVVEADGSLFLDIRLHRYGAIAGTVLDENEIGIPDQQVVAYHNKTPLEVVARAITDDRGIYRIHGLEPGAYFVRTAAKILEDGSGLLPTFHKQTTTLDEAMAVEVALDQQADDVDIRPVAGKLVRVTGKVVSYLPRPVNAKVILISDAGRVSTESGENDTFTFEEVAPGNYELLAVAGDQAAFRELVVDKDTEAFLNMAHLPTVTFSIEDEKSNRIDTANARLLARRKDLDGPGEVQVLKLVKDTATLGPGKWEMSMVSLAGYYPTEFGRTWPGDLERHRADGWNEVELRRTAFVDIKVSSHPASVHGLVIGSGQDPVPGAPVYLEAFDQDTRQRLIDLLSTRTDLRGQYHFNNLAPGVYRVLSSFEFEKPDSQTMEAAGARGVSLAEGKDAVQDLDLYVSR